MKYIKNPFRKIGLPAASGLADGAVRSDPTTVLRLLAQCPVAEKTPLVAVANLAEKQGIANLSVKDESARMGLGSFKALGAAYAIAKQAHEKLGDKLFEEGQAKESLKGQVFTSATAGNHGLSIAAGARIFGAEAVIFISDTVPEDFATRLKSFGARVVRQGSDYAASLDAAKEAAASNGWQLLSDTSWPGYTALPLDIMEGYLALAAETVDQAADRNFMPTHVFLQAGVGGLAAGVAAHLRARWGQDFHICVVEPTFAPALYTSIEAGKPVIADGPVSNMGRLDCKEPSHLALRLLARDADSFMLVSDEEVSEAIKELDAEGLKTTPSGGAGYAGLKAVRTSGDLGLDSSSKVLVILSEGPEDS